MGTLRAKSLIANSGLRSLISLAAKFQGTVTLNRRVEKHFIVKGVTNQNMMSWRVSCLEIRWFRLGFSTLTSVGDASGRCTLLGWAQGQLSEEEWNVSLQPEPVLSLGRMLSHPSEITASAETRLVQPFPWYIPALLRLLRRNPSWNCLLCFLYKPEVSRLTLNHF